METNRVVGDSFKVRAAVSALAAALALVSVGAADAALRIMGFKYGVESGAWPWQVALMKPQGDGFRQFCGGSVIHERWVLTAAHCVDGDDPDDVQVLVGAHDLDEGGRRIDVETIRRRRDYRDDPLVNDIALLELARPADVEEVVTLADAERSAELTKPGVMATAIGWGLLFPLRCVGGSKAGAHRCRPRGGGDGHFVHDLTGQPVDPSDAATSHLMQVELPLVGEQACREAYPGAQIDDRTLCAGYRLGGKGTCQGDGGGPLVVKDGDGWVQVGIVSWGAGCGKPGKYDVYTNVGAFAEWVNWTTGLEVAVSGSTADAEDRAAPPSPGGERVALVIGNSRYEHVSPDPSGSNDAESVGAALERLGFTVTTLKDAGYVDMAWGLEEFARAAQSVQTAVVFYAGHGHAADGRNFLAPVDTRPKAYQAAAAPDAVNLFVTQANFGLIPVEWLMRSVAGASNLRLVVLDTDVHAPLEPAGGTIVAQAAAGGSAAAGGGDRNSPYTEALLRYLEEPDLELGMLFRKVRDDVMRATEGGQEPVVYGLPGRGIYLGAVSGQLSRKTFRDCPECPELVVVPSGSFMMGSPGSEEGRYDDEGPVHRVRIAEPFAVGVYEVTRGEYGRFVSATGHASGDSCMTYEQEEGEWEEGEWEERSGRNWRNPGFRQTDEHPVVCVSWEDAQAYVRWLSVETGEAYRLLSEAEWEYVARGGTETARYWGESESGQCHHANGADMEAKRHASGWTVVDCDDGYYRTSPVGTFSANRWKLHDVLGNAWEWVEDCWNDSYAGAPGDGSAWESGNCGVRVLRGGSWVSQPRDLRSAGRSGDTPGSRGGNVGFRVARTLTP